MPRTNDTNGYDVIVRLVELLEKIGLVIVCIVPIYLLASRIDSDEFEKTALQVVGAILVAVGGALIKIYIRTRKADANRSGEDDDDDDDAHNPFAD